MLQKIEDINLLKLANDIKYMVFNNKTEMTTDDYELSIKFNTDVSELKPLLILLDSMIIDKYLITELYFEGKDSFKKFFNNEYSNKLNEVFHSIWIDKIKCESEDTYSGTFIYHESVGEKFVFQLSCIRYLRKFQKEENWK